jgi:hypothetical protein
VGLFISTVDFTEVWLLSMENPMTHVRMVFVAGGLVLGACLIGLPCRSTAADDEIPKDVKEGLAKISGLIENSKKDEAKKAAEAWAKKAGFAAASPGSLETLMHVFAPRAKKGLGVGDKPGTVKPDGIELKIQALGDMKNKPLTKKQIDAESADIKKMALVTAAVAEVTLTAAPKKDMGKLKAKDWIKWSEEMRDSAVKLAEAAEKKNEKLLQPIARTLDGSCTSCHEVFRK